jgi:hypothetical protein
MNHEPAVGDLPPWSKAGSFDGRQSPVDGGPCWSTSETSWLRPAGNLRVILLRSGLLGVVSGA